MSFTRNRLLSLPLIVLLLQTGHAQALGLLDAYEAALKNDATYQSAIHENEAGQQAAEIGLAGLLPNLSISHTQSKNTGTRTITGTANSAGAQPLNFDSQISTLSLRQPLLNLEAVAGYRQGIAQANSSQAKFTGHSQQLLVRLVETYMEVLLAQNHLQLVQTQHDALAELKLVNEHMLQKGEGTTTDVLETQSKYALAQAQIIEAQDELEVSRLRLASIIGEEVTQLDRLSDHFQIQAIQLPDYDNWQALALDRNAELVTQRHTVMSEKEQIRKSHSGHAPRIDLVASLSRNKSASFVTANQDVNLATIGVEVNIPLYAGGRVSAITSQATANHARAEADLDAMTHNVLVELRKQYKLISSSVRRIASLELAVESARLLVQATQKSIQGGVRINLDLLNAQQQLFTAQGDLAQARYNYLLAYLRLQLTAGTLVLDDLRKIATYFTSEN
ncbi:outer membrane protein, protease secretion system [Nitrosomonas cryotolerans]|uniref:Outer membrane protein HasF n=1 Tax=Nitrosomonas cryotolerans ATCC 49181 TaxID=1131553 RepID=A0A1N6GWV4_9PROT|nr:TolC family outer membrane protein [Nitrosomonas cryotolerans]SFP42000.1 outer membrane protein, protease secretion system [Nitrosomonas cryotolerans]SIO11986.1 outer membrane protein HasF [Nitrosomonas cryotolerans ATCC 49181]